MRKLVLSSLFLALCATAALAGPKPPGGGGSPACWPPPCSVPVDGGITLLLAAGAALGTKKIIDARKQKQ